MSIRRRAIKAHLFAAYGEEQDHAKFKAELKRLRATIMNMIAARGAKGPQLAPPLASIADGAVLIFNKPHLPGERQ